MGLKNSFDGVSVNRPAFLAENPQLKFQKFEKILGKIQKKTFSREISPKEVPKTNLGTKCRPKRQNINFEDSTYFFT